MTVRELREQLADLPEAAQDVEVNVDVTIADWSWLPVTGVTFEARVVFPMVMIEVD